MVLLQAAPACLLLHNPLESLPQSLGELSPWRLGLLELLATTESAAVSQYLEAMEELASSARLLDSSEAEPYSPVGPVEAPSSGKLPERPAHDMA